MSKRHDIAQRVLGKITSGEVAAQSATPSPAMRTYMGQVAQETARSFEARIEDLELERSTGMVLLRLDPKQIARTAFANRHELGLSASDESFRRLKASIREHGQDTPVRVRPTGPGGGTLPYELVEGHRRHAACLELDAELDGGFPILARLDAGAADSRDLVLKMYRENAERADLSPYEYGRMFRSWLDARVFTTQADLAKSVGLSAPAVTQYLAVAELPAEVLACFPDPRQIAMRWMQPLSKALKADRAHVLAVARRIAERKGPTPPEDALHELTAPKGLKRASPSREEAVKIQGKVAFRLARRDGRLTLKFGPMVSLQAQKELTERIKELAESDLSQRLKGT